MYKVNDNGVEYYTINRIKDIQHQMLHLLSVIDTICRENHLQYYLDGGSAIGAYRHGGFIPWDDDLDISMPKPDYLKLIEILKAMDKSKFFLFDYELNMHSCAFFGEMVPFFSSTDGRRRHIYPIKIDICPMNIIEDIDKSIRENRVFRELAGFVIYGKCNAQFYKEAIELYERRFGMDKKKFLSFYNQQYGMYPELGHAVLAYPSLEFSTDRTYKYNELFPLKEIEFSGLQTFVPNSDLWLKEIYGDYMDMPPVEKRKPEAGKVFEAKKIKPLYEYLVDKTHKTRLQMMVFALKATVFCK